MSNRKKTKKKTKNIVPYFLLQLFDGRMQKQRVYQQVQMKQCSFRYRPEDVIAVVKKPNTNMLTK